MPRNRSSCRGSLCSGSLPHIVPAARVTHRRRLQPPRYPQSRPPVAQAWALSGVMPPTPVRGLTRRSPRHPATMSRTGRSRPSSSAPSRKCTLASKPSTARARVGSGCAASDRPWQRCVDAERTSLSHTTRDAKWPSDVGLLEVKPGVALRVNQVAPRTGRKVVQGDDVVALPKQALAKMGAQ